MSSVSNEATNVGVCLIGAVVFLAGCASEPPSAAKFDFHRDVAPIFKARCLHCHGMQQQQGGLRLDEKSFALLGGLSGKKLVGSSADESELLRRVISADPAIAMPKEGRRLNEQEINLLRRWVELGAPWPDKTPPSGRKEFLSRYGEDLWKRLSVVGHEPKVILLFLVAILIGMADRIRRAPADSERWSHGLRRHVHRLCEQVSAAGFLVIVFGVLLWDVVEFAMRQSSHLALTEQKLTEATASADNRPSSLGGAQPMPLRPRGTTGLGGIFYRGNDERNEKLFNGGYYRTATLRLSLIDEHDQPVAIGQMLSGSQLWVRLEIERALHATPSLFTDQLMNCVLLTRRTGDRKEPFPADEPTGLEVLQTGDRWAAKYRLSEYTGQSEIALNGIIYVYSNGNRSAEAVQGTQQYGIVYALRIRDRTLQENSELWLGPILVPGNFQYLMPGRITLDEWLDTNPLPEITGENTTDPKLLGIPPHVPAGAKLPEE